MKAILLVALFPVSTVQHCALAIRKALFYNESNWVHWSLAPNCTLLLFSQAAPPPGRRRRVQSNPVPTISMLRCISSRYFFLFETKHYGRTLHCPGINILGGPVKTYVVKCTNRNGQVSHSWSWAGPNCIIQRLRHSPIQYVVMIRVELTDRLY